MALFFYKEKNKDIRAAAYLRLSIEDGDKTESNSEEYADDGYTGTNFERPGFKRMMEDTLVWERALSLRNPWIQQMAQYKAPEELDRSFVKKYIEQVTVILLGDGQAEIGLTMKTYEWKQMLGRIEMEETDDGTKE